MKIRLILGVLVALAVVGLFTLFSNLNSLVAQAIEKHGSEATGTKVAVSGVDISLKDGRGGIEGLDIDSPEGFSGKKAFQLDEIAIDIDVKSVRDDPVVIESIVISAPSVHAEFLENGKSNLDEIRKHLDALKPAGGGDGGDGESSELKKVRIESFVFEKGSISVDASALGVESKSLDLPEIRLKNVGGSDGGTPEELAKEILTAVVSRAAREVGESELKGFIERNLSEPVKEGAKKLLDALGN